MSMRKDIKDCIERIKVKDGNSIRSAKREIFSCEELSKSTEVITEAACAYNEVDGDKELRLNKVESEHKPKAQVTNSQLVI
jgi:hypothetical protein